MTAPVALPRTVDNRQRQVEAVGPGTVTDPYQYRPPFTDTGHQAPDGCSTYTVLWCNQHQVERAHQGPDHVAPGGGFRRCHDRQAFKGNPGLAGRHQPQVGVANDGCPRTHRCRPGHEGHGQGTRPGTGDPDAAATPEAVEKQACKGRDDRQRALHRQGGGTYTPGSLGQRWNRTDR